MIEQNNITFKDKPVKIVYLWRDLERWAVTYGLAPGLPALPFANQFALLGCRGIWGDSNTAEAYRLWFDEGKPASSGPNLSKSLTRIYQDPERMLAATVYRMAGYILQRLNVNYHRAVL